MFLFRVVASILIAQVLPGALLVRWFGVGRDVLERWLMSAVMGGPLAALIYLVSLKADSDALYWTLLGVVDSLALVVLIRGRARKRETGSRVSRSLLARLVLLIVLVEAAYFSTTGHLFRLDGDGNLVMDRALQRDTLFHIGMVRSLTSSYPPELFSISGIRAGYHVGYHLQLAAWMRFFGIDAFDGVYRLGAGWSLALLILSAYAFGRRFTGGDEGAIVITVLLFGGGLGFLFASAGAGWWSLLFMDAALVSIFLPNPLLPALPLLMVGLACLADYLSEPRAGRLAASTLCLTSLFAVKVFLGAQVLAALALAAVVSRAESQSRLLRAFAVIGLASTPLLLHTLFGFQSGNTAIILRPLEIVRYSMELLGWKEGVDALVQVGSPSEGSAHISDWALALAATLWWTLGFLGLRLLGLKALFYDLTHRRDSIRLVMAFIAIVGFPITLLLRIAPADSTGLSRLESINDVFWFATQSGILLWFWSAETLLALVGHGGYVRKVAIALVAGAVAFPCTIQHFVLKHSLDVDRVPADIVEAAEQVRRVSSPGEVWVEPPDRVHPSPIAYLSGRPVVYDGYVGYDYMFVPREKIDFRRHAVAQFWRTEDKAFGAWFIDRYGVKGVYATESLPLPHVLLPWVRLRFSNGSVSLHQVERDTLYFEPIVSPARLPMGLGGAHFFGRGWGRPSGTPRTRSLPPGTACLYIPLEQDIRLELRFYVRTPHTAGQLVVEGSVAELERTNEIVVVPVKMNAGGRGLRRINVQWTGSQGLTVERIDVLTSTILGR